MSCVSVRRRSPPDPAVGTSPVPAAVADASGFSPRVHPDHGSLRASGTFHEEMISRFHLPDIQGRSMIVPVPGEVPGRIKAPDVCFARNLSCPNRRGENQNQRQGRQHGAFPHQVFHHLIDFLLFQLGSLLFVTSIGRTPPNTFPRPTPLRNCLGRQLKMAAPSYPAL